MPCRISLLGTSQLSSEVLAGHGRAPALLRKHSMRMGRGADKAPGSPEAGAWKPGAAVLALAHQLRGSGCSSAAHVPRRRMPLPGAQRCHSQARLVRVRPAGCLVCSTVPSPVCTLNLGLSSIGMQRCHIDFVAARTHVPNTDSKHNVITGRASKLLRPTSTFWWAAVCCRSAPRMADCQCMTSCVIWPGR